VVESRAWSVEARDDYFKGKNDDKQAPHLSDQGLSEAMVVVASSGLPLLSHMFRILHPGTE
jgi:hypothetical protein